MVHAGAMKLRDLFRSMSSFGRGLEGSAAYPAPPELPIPEDLKRAIDEENEANGHDPR